MRAASELYSALVRLREVLRKNQDRIVNEAMTSSFLVVPFLRELGWDTSDPRQTLFEYCGGFTAGDGKRNSDRMDIALLTEQGGDTEPVVGVEVKRVGTDVCQCANQLLRYMAQSRDMWLGMVTDGATYQLWMRRKVVTGQGNNKRVVTEDPDVICTFTLDSTDVVLERLAGELCMLGLGFQMDVWATQQAVARLQGVNARIDAVTAALRGHRSGEDAAFDAYVRGDYPVLTSEDCASVVRTALQVVYGNRWTAESFRRDVEDVTDSRIVTTAEELELYDRVVAVVLKRASGLGGSTQIAADKLSWRDTQNYFNVLFGTRWFVRFYGNGRRKYLAFPPGVVTSALAEGLRTAGFVGEETRSPASEGYRVYLDDTAQVWALGDPIWASLQQQLR